jgi:hypothetical protein
VDNKRTFVVHRRIWRRVGADASLTWEVQIQTVLCAWRAGRPPLRRISLCATQESMGFFYFDESIHARGGFILGAYVAAGERLDPHVEGALARHGLRPGLDEYKSSANMAGNLKLDPLREDPRHIVARCELAVVIAPIDLRQRLGTVALQGLRQVLETNRLADRPHTVFLDAGIRAPSSLNAELLHLGGLHPDSTVRFGADSRLVGGLQLADCAAHTAATVLLEEMGLVQKDVAGREADAWEPNELYPLGFQLWATMRQAFFNGGLRPEPRGDDYFVDVFPYGLYIAPETPPTLADHAMKRFGRAYLGCIR